MAEINKDGLIKVNENVIDFFESFLCEEIVKMDKAYNKISSLRIRSFSIEELGEIGRNANIPVGYFLLDEPPKNPILTIRDVLKVLEDVLVEIKEENTKQNKSMKKVDEILKELRVG